MKKLISYFIIVLFFLGLNVYSQVGIGTDNPSPSSILDIVSDNKGILLPQISLTGINDTTTVNKPKIGLLVYNLGNAGTDENQISSGYYYWNGTLWIRMDSKEVKSNLRLIPGNNHLTQDSGVGGNGTDLGSGVRNIAIGGKTLSKNTTGKDNIAIGNRALEINTSGELNIAIGERSLLLNTTGKENTVLGIASTWTNSEGNYNVVIGNQTFMTNKTGSNNTVLGYQSLYSNGVGNNNTALGYKSLHSTMGTNNIGIGANTESTNLEGSNQMNIANIIFGNDLTGNRVEPKGNIGIGEPKPTAKLEVKGTFKLVDGTQGIDKILTSDKDGLATWKTLGNGIYTTNGSLTENRTIEQKDKTLAFTSTATTGTSHFSVDESTFNINAVNNNVGIGTNEPNKSAILDLNSKNKALLIPRVSLTGSNDLNTIPNPVGGMIVYNTSEIAGEFNIKANSFYYFNGSSWVYLVNNQNIKVSETSVNTTILGYIPKKSSERRTNLSTVRLGKYSVTEVGCQTNPTNKHVYCAYKLGGNTNSEGINFYDTFNFVKEQGGYLVTMTDNDERIWVNQNILTRYDLRNSIWIGYTKINTPGNPVHFRWITGEEFKNNWTPGGANTARSEHWFNDSEPNNAQGVEGYSHIHPLNTNSERKWNDVRGDSTNYVNVGFNQIIVEFNE